MKKGKLSVIYGPMFSGKTTYLIKQFGNGEGTVVFKPDLDQRYTKQPVVVSHDKAEIPAVLVNNLKPEEMNWLVGEFARVMIDEVNFFVDSLIPVVKQFLNDGRDVYVSGLVLDSEGGVFGPMTKLVAIADEKIEVSARCDGQGGKCKNPATLSYRKIPKTEQVKVGGVDEYGACCSKHYDQLHQKGS